MCKKFNSKSSNRSEYKCHNYYFSGLFSAMIRITLEISWFSSVFPASFDIWPCSNKVWQINARGFSKVRSSSGNISWGGTFFFFFENFVFRVKLYTSHSLPGIQTTWGQKKNHYGLLQENKKLWQNINFKDVLPVLEAPCEKSLVVLGYLSETT